MNHSTDTETGQKSQKVCYYGSFLLEGHNATYDDFSILIPENNQFKLHLKESLFIKRDSPRLNRNITPIHQSFSHNDISY